ncbi:hypothetical protein ANN_23466 [Periplaneta americana]|uniref:Cytochrome P450 n=1 Tax=Periplaneta americana TaxID=6978 RepID=A0ABQ8SN89_PERAM|nr:hypothetical protein ANN_23466 [Periplaneta americana]
MISVKVITTSTSYTAVAAMNMLSKNQDKQEKLFEEVQRVLPNKRDPLTSEKLNELKYLKACMKETMRRQTAGRFTTNFLTSVHRGYMLDSPMTHRQRKRTRGELFTQYVTNVEVESISPIAGGNQRTLVKDLVLANYRVPKGTSIIMPGLLLSRMDKHFPQANKFIPERWLKGEPESKMKLHAFVTLPFGFGPRMCIGRRFAELEIETLLAKETVRSGPYLDMLENFSEPQLQQENNMSIVFQQDSAPPHWATDVRYYLDETFGNNWCGRGGPITWPPNSPDMTTPDFFPWGFVKNYVYAQRPSDIHDFRAKIFSAFEKVTPEMLDHTWEELASRYELSRARNCGHVDVLDKTSILLEYMYKLFNNK